MLIKKRPSWAMAEADATSEHIYLNRREWLRAAGFAGLGLTTALDWRWRVCGGGGCCHRRISSAAQYGLSARPRYYTRR